LNYLFDRVIDEVDLVLMGIHEPPVARAFYPYKTARHVGNLSDLIREFPRWYVYQLTGHEWNIIVVGSESSRDEISQLFFPDNEDMTVHHVGRIALWELTKQTQIWLDPCPAQTNSLQKGESMGIIDLVVCESSCSLPYHPQEPITFVIPNWVNQEITLPHSANELLAGKKFATTRHRLNKAKRNGFSYHFSQDKADFDNFYYNMYLPYVIGRHGKLAVIAKYSDQKNRWFLNGGLVLITHHDVPVAGVLCYMAGDTCFDVERGILGSSSKLFKQGIETIATWAAIDWAYKQHATFFNMGGSHGWVSNGTFSTKRRWKAKVIRRKRIYKKWTFSARQLSPSKQACINKIGFITEIDKSFYRVMLDVNTESININLKAELISAQKEGLQGLYMLSPHEERCIQLPTPYHS